MLAAIWAGQPACSATQPSQTVAAVSEKHIMANQSRVLITPRRKVGRARAARMALGTASVLYSGSKGSALASSVSRAPMAKLSGMATCGARNQPRQRHSARRASGQVGQRNHGRSRRMLPQARALGQAKALPVQSSQLSVQYGPKVRA